MYDIKHFLKDVNIFYTFKEIIHYKFLTANLRNCFKYIN